MIKMKTIRLSTYTFLKIHGKYHGKSQFHSFHDSDAICLWNVMKYYTIYLLIMFIGKNKIFKREKKISQ